MNQTPLGTYDSIAITAIRPSPTNPRKNFDQAALDELTASIREIGVAEPITLRPWRRGRFFVRNQRDFDVHSTVAYLCHPKLTNDGQFNIVDTFTGGSNEENVKWAQDEADKRNEEKGVYELVTGERRWRAAQAAGLETIPAVVRELSDREAEELQLVENLQRADLHPVEEAEGYRALLAKGLAFEDVAKSVGKTAAHVHKLVKLLMLELPAKTLFHAGHLTLGHALLLARLTPADQDRAMRYLLRAEGDYKKMSTEEVMEQRIRNKETNSWAKNSRIVDRTEGDLRDWIAENIVLSLAKVPWSLADATLVPEAGPCTTCPKRSEANAALFADITVEKDKCLDTVCFQTKQKASVRVTIQASAEEGRPIVKLVAKTNHQPIGEITPKTKLGAGQWVEVEPMSCASVTRGLLVEEPPRFSGSKHKVGDVITVCADQKCKVHKHHVDQPSPKGSTSSGRAVANSYEAREKAEQAKRDAYVAAERPIRARVVRAILDNAEPGIFELRSGIAAYVTSKAAVCEELGIEFKKDSSTFASNNNAAPALEKFLETATYTQLARVVLINAVARDLEPNQWAKRERDRERLWKIAEHYEIDADAIAAEVEAEQKSAAPAAPVPAKTPAKKKKLKAAEQKKRKAEAAKKHVPAKKVAAKKVNTNLTPESRKRIADAMKRRFEQRRGVVDGKSAGAGARAQAGLA